MSDDLLYQITPFDISEQQIGNHPLRVCKPGGMAVAGLATITMIGLPGLDTVSSPARLMKQQAREGIDAAIF
jgi:hypothetical protein